MTTPAGNRVTSDDDRQKAIGLLTKIFTDDGRDPDESRDVATAVIDQAIADRKAGRGAGRIQPGRSY